MTARYRAGGSTSAWWLVAVVVGATACGGPPSASAPGAFSHRRHADHDIDCRFCHPAVEVGAAAGMPTAATCRSCHHAGASASVAADAQRGLATVIVPTAWHRRCWVPSDVRFDHASHFAAGVGCASCHGTLDRLDASCVDAPVTMIWCLDCHRDPTVTAAAEPPTHCSGCHR